MSTHCGYITTLKNVRKHPNADKLLLAECFGNTVCVSLEYVDGQVGVYFPTDLQLSVEYAEKNNLLRKKDAEGNNIGGYMDPDKRNVTSIRLRGGRSDGLFMPLSSLDYCYPDIKGGAAVMLNIGDTIDVVNGHDVCTKYIPVRKSKRERTSEGNKTRKKKVPVAPLFAEHADTEQLAYNMDAFKEGDLVEITLKMHGTSQRTGFLPTLKGYKRTLLDKILKREGTPIYDWGLVSGTRRCVLGSYDGGFYGSNAFRQQHERAFIGKLRKGEEVFYEVVGFTDSGVPIMGDASNKGLNDKEFVKQYGEVTRFSYGCEPDGYIINEDGAKSAPVEKPQSDLYVYRMTMTNEDGDIVEYTPDFMRYRCEQMGVKCVQVFEKFIIPDGIEASPGEYVKSIAEKYYDGPDPVGKTHIREGVVCRIVNRPKFAAYKHKNFSFKCLSGIAVDTINPDTVNEDILSEM